MELLPVCTEKGDLVPPDCVMPTLLDAFGLVDFVSVISALLGVMAAVAVVYVVMRAGGLVLSKIQGYGDVDHSDFIYVDGQAVRREDYQAAVDDPDSFHNWKRRGCKTYEEFCAEAGWDCDDSEERCASIDYSDDYDDRG